MEEGSGIRRRAATLRAVGLWYRRGLALADARPPHAYAHAYDLGRRMAALRRPARLPPVHLDVEEGKPYSAESKGPSMMQSLQSGGRMPANPSCAYCAGAGEVSGVVDDVQFTFRCPCAGGSEEAVRWLVGTEGGAPPGEDWII